MAMTRRQALALLPGAAAATLAANAQGDAGAVEDALRAFTRGVEPQPGRIALTVEPQIENGNAVPVSVSVESPMTDADHVEAVLILAERNPTPVVATLAFTPASGAAFASLRVRLSQSQTVTAVARMRDGAAFVDRRSVEVTVGGCGAT
jgi:sulfur-oxidizing protein SoxY